MKKKLKERNPNILQKLKKKGWFLIISYFRILPIKVNGYLTGKQVEGKIWKVSFGQIRKFQSGKGKAKRGCTQRNLRLQEIGWIPWKKGNAIIGGSSKNKINDIICI